MILNKWRLEAIVRSKPGLSLAEFATELGVGRGTALRHARRHKFIVVEDSRGGKGVKTRLWLKWNLPDRLIDVPPADDAVLARREPRTYTLEDL